MTTSVTGFDLSDFQDYIKAQGPDLRPILVSLNGDNSWLWSFPRPAAERKLSGKAYFHIVFEPWLDGATGLFGPIGRWLIHLSLATPPAATNGRDVDVIVKQIEDAWTAVYGDGSEPKSHPDALPGVDAILLGFHYPDHLHPPTLLTFSPNIPIICTPQCVKQIHALAHFANVSMIADVDASTSSWRNLPHPGGLPEWLQPVRMAGHHELNYLFSLIWTHAAPSSGPRGNGVTVRSEAIYQSPHGIRLDQKPFQAFIQTSGLPEPLVLFHGLKENHAAGSKNTYGAEAGLSVWRALGEPKSWIISHNSALRYAGAVMWMFWVMDTPRTIDWALEREGRGREGTKPNMVDVGNGQAFML